MLTLNQLNQFIPIKIVKNIFFSIELPGRRLPAKSPPKSSSYTKIKFRKHQIEAIKKKKRLIKQKKQQKLMNWRKKVKKLHRRDVK